MITLGRDGSVGAEVGWSLQAISAALANARASAVRRERMGSLRRERVLGDGGTEQID
jgi:hypothetical protein